MNARGGVLPAIVAAAILLGVPAMGQPSGEDDPYLWLEDIGGEAPLAWVREQNAIALGELKGDPGYRQNYDDLLAILDASDRIPNPALRGEFVFNFWQDAEHVRGLWRRTSIASYESAAPEWEVLLDIDRLAGEEDKNWVYEGTSCAPSLGRCIVSLSNGGTDAAEMREFDLNTKNFTENGFVLAEAKSDAAYAGDDTVLFATDFGAGTLTQSGYPRIVKRWRRGAAIGEAQTIFEGTVEDVGSWPFVLQGPDGSYPMIERALSFWESEYYFVKEDGETLQLPLPLSAGVRGMTGGQLIATLRQEWTPPGRTSIAQGSLIAFALDEFLASGALPEIAVLYTPGPRGSIEGVAPGRDAVYAGIFENVTGSVYEFTRGENGEWASVKLPLPAGGSTGISSANDFGPEAYFSYQGFLTPNTLYAGGESAPRAIKSLPAQFAAEGYRSAQYEATSRDGTKIPYFVVRAEDANGPVPTVLYGYGGFENSLTPWYWSSAGKVWLSKGGSYAVANIRGGGEFGPAWHEAALKTNRQRAYDDFIAVAEDMVARGLTAPEKLGIMGGSNGGLLVGAVAMQRPELFGAVVCQVPLLDMIRYMQIGAGASWEGEYGDPDNPEERAAILEYSPYQNVHPWMHYPPVFFVTATSDDRVTPVHARKMAAKMMAQGHDLLFYENTDGGHAAAANHAQAAEMWALTYVYLAQKLGLER